MEEFVDVCENLLRVDVAESDPCGDAVDDEDSSVESEAAEVDVAVFEDVAVEVEFAVELDFADRVLLEESVPVSVPVGVRDGVRVPLSVPVSVPVGVRESVPVLDWAMPTPSCEITSSSTQARMPMALARAELLKQNDSATLRVTMAERH